MANMNIRNLSEMPMGRCDAGKIVPVVYPLQCSREGSFPLRRLFKSLSGANDPEHEWLVLPSH